MNKTDYLTNLMHHSTLNQSILASPPFCQITEADYPVLLDLRYTTSNNITGTPLNPDNRCFIHADALILLKRSIELARQQGLCLRIFDAYRPRTVQEALWNHCPNPDYITPPERGSPHTRGVAIDLTLVDENGQELDMGTPFDDLTPRSHHGRFDLSPHVAANRYKLLGIMMSAGWDFYACEWWHYQVFKARDYPLIEHYA